MRTLCRDLSYVFPNLIRINRGKLSLEGVAEKAVEFDIDKVTIISRWEKGLGKLEFFELPDGDLRNVLPTAYLRDARFRRDFGEQVSKGMKIESVAINAVSKENFDVKKFEDFFASFFSVPVLSLEGSVSGNYDAVMQILLNHTKRITITFRLIPELIEIGPRIEISHLTWKMA
jgi:rRNA maturation protein Rpf1